MHYYQFNIADYRKDTVHLTPIEHYFYRQMLDNYYLSEQPIPNDENKIMRSLCVRNADDMQAVKNVLSDFFFLAENGYIHKRCDVEIEAYHSKSKSASESAKARWANKNKGIDANALRTHSECNANHKPLTINHIDKNIVTNDVADCPHQEIISLYKKYLPMGIVPLTWDGSRASQLKARWREQPKRQNLDWWKGLFEYITKSEFLTGQITSENRKPFIISLDWIVKSENFKKITEGKYHG